MMALRSVTPRCRFPRLLAAGATAAALMVSTVDSASAQPAYVADSGGALAIVDTATNVPLGSIPLGGEPIDVAITPDASRAYVVDTAREAVLAVDIATNSLVADPIPVGTEPRGLAIAPHGGFAAVANRGSDSITVIDLTTNEVTAAAIAVGEQPEGVAITPDARRILAAQRGGDVSIVDVASRSVVGVVPDALGPSKLALTLDGTRGLTANADSNSVSVFSTLSGSVFGVPVLVGANPGGVVVSPNGFAYATSTSNNTVTAIDITTHAKVGPPISGFAGPKGLAARADGSRVYVANSAAGSLSILDTDAAAVVGQIPAGLTPQAVAIRPDQPPRASFAAQLLGKRGTRVAFDASTSNDLDGKIATYTWDFGDGQSETGPEPIVTHAYAEPGAYRVKLVVTDAEGCSTTLLFTGQTATCNGSSIAVAHSAVEVPDRTKPRFRLVGARRQLLGRWVTVVGHCPDETCFIAAHGTLRTRSVRKAPRAESNRGARRKSRVARDRRPLRRARSRIRDGGQATLRLRLPARALASARSVLRRGGTATVAVRAFARDLAGNRSRRRLRVRLVKPGPKSRRTSSRSTGW